MISVMQCNPVNPPAPEEKYVDPVIEYYKARIDKEQIRRNLRLTVQERIDNLMNRLREIDEVNEAQMADRRGGLAFSTCRSTASRQ